MEKENINTRYFIDLELETMTLIHWGFAQKDIPKIQKSFTPNCHRIFLTKGQNNKLLKVIID